MKGVEVVEMVEVVEEEEEVVLEVQESRVDVRERMRAP